MKYSLPVAKELLVISSGGDPNTEVNESGVIYCTAPRAEAVSSRQISTSELEPMLLL